MSFALDMGPDVGWFAYVPLSGPQYGAGKRADIWAQMITFTEVAALAVAVEIVVTVFKQRAPGMTLDRIPLFVWAMLVTSFLVILAMPAIVLASTSLILDRLVGTHFFNPAEGGDVLLYQHLFWFFGHPEVYIIFLPAVGMVSTIVATFSQRPVFGYLPLVMALVATGILSFGLWVHHMFVTGLPRLGESFFTASSMAIAIPAGVQIFCWLATLWGGRPRFDTPLLFVIGFFVTFVIGGLTGVMVASVPFDTQVHDTYFVVAHFHYVLVGGAVFPLLAAVTYWFPKFTGRLMDERLGRWSCLADRRRLQPDVLSHAHSWPAGHAAAHLHLPDRPALAGNEHVCQHVRGGPDGRLSAVLYQCACQRPARCDGRCQPVAGIDAWSGRHRHRRRLTTSLVSRSSQRRDPLWEQPEMLPVVEGLRTDRRELLVSSVVEARPEARESSPRNSIWPLVTAIATTIMLIWSIFTPWGVVWGSIPVAVCLIGWFWPEGTPEDDS